LQRPVPLLADLADRLDDPAGALPDPQELRWAAVIGLLLRTAADDADPRLLLIHRSPTMAIHAGQLAFPGGKHEPHDASLLATALREATEEVDLPVAETMVLGRLSPVPTPSGYMIMPFVGLAPLGWQPRAADAEVHELVMPTLGRLADPTVHRLTGSRPWRGRPFPMHEYAIHDPPLWGASAFIVWELLQRLGLSPH